MECLVKTVNKNVQHSVRKRFPVSVCNSLPPWIKIVQIAGLLPKNKSREKRNKTRYSSCWEESNIALVEKTLVKYLLREYLSWTISEEKILWRQLLFWFVLYVLQLKMVHYGRWYYIKFSHVSNNRRLPGNLERSWLKNSKIILSALSNNFFEKKITWEIRNSQSQPFDKVSNESSVKKSFFSQKVCQEKDSVSNVYLGVVWNFQVIFLDTCGWLVPSQLIDGL